MRHQPKLGLQQSLKKLLFGLAFLAVLLFFYEKWLLFIGDVLIARDNLHSADVIHVIAGEDYRTDYAIQLYKQRYGRIIFFTGGWCVYHQYNHGEHGEEQTLAHGVPLDAIVFDDSKVTSTYAEAEKLNEWVKKNPYPIRSIIVVSDPFHMRRVLWTYKKVMGDSIEVQMAPVPFVQTPYKRQWWKDPLSRNYVRDEYQKYIYYILRYQISSGRFQEWLVALDSE